MSHLFHLLNKGIFYWDAPHSTAQPFNWSRHYAALLNYGEEHGHCNVPIKAVYECILIGMGDNGEDFQYKGNLGTWLRAQRGSHNGRKGCRPLTAEREASLQKLVDEGIIF